MQENYHDAPIDEQRVEVDPGCAAAPAGGATAGGATAGAQAISGGDSERHDALARTEGMLDDLIVSDDSKFDGDAAAESAAQRDQAGWQAASEDAAAHKILAAAASVPAGMIASMPASVLAAAALRPPPQQRWRSCTAVP